MKSVSSNSAATTENVFRGKYRQKNRKKKWRKNELASSQGAKQGEIDALIVKEGPKNMFSVKVGMI